MRLADRYDAILLDVDGVVHRGGEAIPGSAQTVSTLRREGKRLVFVTNNSASTPERVAEGLRSLGVEAAAGEVVTSAHAVVPLIRSLLGDGDLSAFVLGEEGLRTALTEAGILVTDGHPARVDLVVVGLDRTADYDRIRTASVLVQRGARLVATNADPSKPAPKGELWPGAGALLAAVETTTGVRAAVAGKPGRPLLDEAVARAGSRSALLVGDRIDTDVAGAERAGLDAALVRSGATEPARLLDHDELPVAVVRDLRELLLPVPAVRVRPAQPEERDRAAKLVALAGLEEPPPDRNRLVLVAVDDGAVLGTATVGAEGSEAYLHSVAVDESARGSGVGTLVVAAGAREARALGASTLFLLTEEAAGFFVSLGFEPIARDALPAWIAPLAIGCATGATAMRRRISTGE